MSARIIRKQSGLECTPMPGIQVEYTYHPAQPGSFEEPYEPARVELETVRVGGVDVYDAIPWLTLDVEALEELILKGR